MAIAGIALLRPYLPLPSGSALPVYGKQMSLYEQIISGWSSPEEALKAVSCRFCYKENTDSIQEEAGSLRKEFEYLLKNPEHQPCSHFVPGLLDLNRTCQLFAGLILFDPN